MKKRYLRPHGALKRPDSGRCLLSGSGISVYFQLVRIGIAATPTNLADRIKYQVMLLSSILS